MPKKSKHASHFDSSEATNCNWGWRQSGATWRPAEGLWHQSTTKLICYSAVALLLSQLVGVVHAQGPGNGQNEAPAFSEPRFQDRIWEEGGPMFKNIENGQVVLSVEIEGNETISESSILTNMQTREDRIFDGQLLTRDIASLYSTDMFSTIHAYFSRTESGIHIRMVVMEKPSITELVFHGNERVNDSELRKQAGIKIGDPTSPASVQHIRTRLEELYREKGFNDVAIRVVSGDRPNDRSVMFEIHEGQLNRIWDIDIVGSEYFSESLLLTKIRSRSARYGATAYIGNVAKEDQIQADLDTLEQYYRSLGFVDAKVDVIKTFDDSGKWVNLTFVVSEGERYTVNEISVKGNKYFEAAILTADMRLKPGEPFFETDMLRDTQLLYDVYGSRGFTFAEITPIPIVLENNQINILYEIEEGDVYVASEIRVHLAGDNSYTKHAVVLRNMGYLRPGRLLDSRELKNAERMLKFSSIFEVDPLVGDPPRIEVLPVDEQTAMDDPVF